MGTTTISWCDYTWNIVTGCTKITTGCRECYAEELHNKRHEAYKKGKLQNMPQYAEPFSKVQLHPDRLSIPLRMRKGRKIFVNSMSDLFHPEVPFKFIDKVMHVIAQCHWHTFQILTKRLERALEYFNQLKHKHPNLTFPFKNLWFGVTTEDQEQADIRIPLALQIPAGVIFISVEPMLSEITLRGKNLGGTQWIGGQRGCEGKHSHNNKHEDGTPGNILHHHHDDRCNRGIDLVVCGGESGKNARPTHPDWVISLKNQCIEAGVPFHFKQWGEWTTAGQCPPDLDFEKYKCKQDTSGIGFYRVGKRNSGCLVDGVEYKEFPKNYF